MKRPSMDHQFRFFWLFTGAGNNSQGLLQRQDKKVIQII
jgi:hypothetical protein